MEQKLNELCEAVNNGYTYEMLDFTEFPSIQFAFETAFVGLKHVQPFLYFDTDFVKGQNAIPINGLVWMNDKETMLQEALQKVEAGFTCIKFKVGALDFDEECRMLEAVRKEFNAFKIEIRLDANGAFSQDDVFEKLKDFSRFQIHSIEQPIKQKQWDLMQEICVKSPVTIALDEELIGVDVQADGQKLLNHIKPQYLILKPTLIGGLAASESWIALAKKHNAGWWATSALESNIGLNAIAQWVSTQRVQMPQGLGTGGLYTNNFQSPLTVANGKISYDTGAEWII